LNEEIIQLVVLQGIDHVIDKIDSEIGKEQDALDQKSVELAGQRNLP